MFRRSILDFASRRSFRTIPRQPTYQTPSFIYTKKQFSTSSEGNGSPKTGSEGKTPEAKSNSTNFVLGSAIFAGVALLAYQSGYLDKVVGKDEQGSHHSAKLEIDHKQVKETQDLGEQVVSTTSEEPSRKSESQIDLPGVATEKKIETLVDLPQVATKKDDESTKDSPHVEVQIDVPHQQAFGLTEDGNQTHVEVASDVKTEAEGINVQEKHKLESSHNTSTEASVPAESPEAKTDVYSNENVQVRQVQQEASSVPEDDLGPTQHDTAEKRSEPAVEKDREGASLLDTYLLKDKAEESSVTKDSSEQAIEESDDGSVTADGTVVMNFLQAIHAAEKRQAELDTRTFAEEKKALKEKYEKELRDLRAREFMRAEEAAILDKELKRERAKATAAIRALQEKMEEKLRIELEKKDTEVKKKLETLQELAKAELSAAIANEKAAQIEKMAEANLNINALCMAFYARSEETRQIHSVHKLALGALALEDALTKGLPIQQELDVLNPYIEGIDKDSLLHLVLSTLPEEARHNGTDTLLQLNQKFNALKRPLRHYILMPPGSGGLLAHGLAQVASWLRIKEVDPSGEGIESLIIRVESFLAEGKLAEAADTLQEGVRGSQAEEVAGDWVKRARNRAIIEQALTVLQSYATSISLTQ
ncbi:hypothetical protein K2173_005140 [Erythroxylum novogranatense]|uniref:MICOS complex subunit MIC60 n=1 Tax=Erythroxylum novogranatense TaxID=1862640 RepID=A0AAV8TRD2_9ROSI|nr:hypothetical protein K2173_005140 [Erythroxylum novogranatense]